MVRNHPTGFEIALALLAGACLLALAGLLFGGELANPVIEAQARCCAAVLAGALLLLARRIDSRLAERRPALLALKGAFLASVAAAAWRAGTLRAAALGLAATFALTPLASYYWVMLLLLPLAYGAPAALAILALSALVHAVDALPPPLAFPHALMSAGLALLLLAPAIGAAFPSGRRMEAPTRGAASP